jgi:hypothetical protein
MSALRPAGKPASEKRQTSKEVPKRTLKKRRPNSLLLRSHRCLLWGEHKATKKTKQDGERFEFAVRGISKPSVVLRSERDVRSLTVPGGNRLPG